MDEATQQNAALVEEAAAAAESLQDQAASLTQAVAAFRLRDGSEQAALLTHAVRAAPRQRMPGPVKAMTLPAQSTATDAGDEWEEF